MKTQKHLSNKTEVVVHRKTVHKRTKKGILRFYKKMDKISKRICRISFYLFQIFLLALKKVFLNMKKSKQQAFFWGALVLVFFLVLIKMCIKEEKTDSYEKRCYQTFEHKIPVQKKQLFKEVKLCSDIQTHQGEAHLFIGTFSTEQEKNLDFACLMVGEQVVVDFEKAQAFFYIDKVYPSMTQEAKELLCRDVRTLFMKKISLE